MSEESEAVAALKRGEIGGLEVLVELHQRAALHAAYLICRDRALAEDIVQAAFLRAYERIHQFDERRAFAPWFLRSVINSTLRACSLGSRYVPLSDDSDALTSLPTTDPDLDARILAADTDEAIYAAMAQLSPAQRAVVVMRYYLEMSEAEMAARLTVPRGTIKRRLHDARQRLRHLLPAWVSTAKE